MMNERYSSKSRREYNKKAWVQFQTEYECQAIDECKRNPVIQYLGNKVEHTEDDQVAGREDSVGPDVSERLKSIVEQIRDHFLNCYPAIDENTEYFKVCPCPPGEDADVSIDDIVDDETENEDAENYKKDNNHKNLVPGVESDFSVERATLAEPTPSVTCYEPKCRPALTTMTVFASIFAFTLGHFVNWWKIRRMYKQRAAELKRLKRKNHSLRAERDRLDAYMMSARMSPLTDKKRQDLANEKIERILHSIEESNRKLNEMRQDRAILLEVLHNLRAQGPSCYHQTYELHSASRDCIASTKFDFA